MTEPTAAPDAAVGVLDTPQPPRRPAGRGRREGCSGRADLAARPPSRLVGPLRARQGE